MIDTIPPKTRPEWLKLANGRIKPSKFVLQLRVDRVAKRLNAGNITADEAIDEIYGYLSKYPKAFQDELTEIFGNW